MPFRKRIANLVLGGTMVGLLTTMHVPSLTAGGTREAAPETSLFEHLAGRWVLRGTIDGKPTMHDVEATFVLNRGYIQLHETSREKDATGAPAYEAFVTIGVDKQTGEYTCLWLDNTNSVGLSAADIARGLPTANSIPFLFKVGRGAFHTTFVYTPATDTWQWLMDDESSGKLEPFARVTLTKR